MLWQYSTADNVPNYSPPSSEIWIARPDGTEPTLLLQKQAGGFYWLDDDRILLVTREDKTNISDLDIYTISTKSTARLIRVMNLRNMSIAPGGRSLMYYAPFQENPSNSGIYVLESTPGATPVKMPFFGSWRWRDSNSVFYIPFTPGKPMTFAVYDITTRQNRSLTDASAEPFEIANDDWQVAPDGRAIVFWSATDSALWLATLAP
jgi:Tol biopolymer transport system component